MAATGSNQQAAVWEVVGAPGTDAGAARGAPEPGVGYGLGGSFCRQLVI